MLAGMWRRFIPPPAPPSLPPACVYVGPAGFLPAPQDRVVHEIDLLDHLPEALDSLIVRFAAIGD